MKVLQLKNSGIIRILMGDLQKFAISLLWIVGGVLVFGSALLLATVVNGYPISAVLNPIAELIADMRVLVRPVNTVFLMSIGVVLVGYRVVNTE